MRSRRQLPLIEAVHRGNEGDLHETVVRAEAMLLRRDVDSEEAAVTGQMVVYSATVLVT